jgi:predicted metal-dependent phosphoesterase TrpH
MGGKADLHIHTVYSDGACSARQIVDLARTAGLTTIAITDHDHTGALDEALSLGEKAGIVVIPGVELSASVEERDIHILGYFLDHRNPRIQEYLTVFRAERVKRAERIVGKLNDLQVPLTFGAVLEQAREGAVGRPHIANALVEQGLTDSYYEAFLKYIGVGKPAYEKKFQISPREAMDLVASAGGLSFIAHPGTTIDDNLLLRLIHDGADGIEAVHPCHSDERVAYYTGIATEYFLLTSGGSDFHGGRKNGEDLLGRYVITEDDVEAMRRRLR